MRVPSSRKVKLGVRLKDRFSRESSSDLTASWCFPLCFDPLQPRISRTWIKLRGSSNCAASLAPPSEYIDLYHSGQSLFNASGVSSSCLGAPKLRDLESATALDNFLNSLNHPCPIDIMFRGSW